MAVSDDPSPSEHVSTRLIHTRDRRLLPATVNPPVERGSTLLFKTRAALYGQSTTYGRMGHAVHEELRAALMALEHANTVVLAPNGVSACALAIASQVRAGDHVLISDGLYGPTRRFCERRLAAMGVTAERYAPRIGAGIAAMARSETRLLVMETPSSLTFEVPDLPAMIAVAKDRGIHTVVDNTWAAGMFLKPLDLGADISVQALTKYAIGHADAFGGAVMANDDRVGSRLRACANDWGIALGPEEAYVALRGLRTLPTRLAAHETNGLALARWFAEHPMVDRVLHPGLESHPDHLIWTRDFSGSCGLFGVVLKPVLDDALDQFLEAMNLFGMGFSWGGYESLLIPCNEQLRRLDGDVSETFSGPLLRIHAGLENPSDLIADLSQAMAHLDRT